MFDSVGERLRQHATNHPDRIACTFLRDGDRDEVSWTNQDMYCAAVATARHLRSLADPGDRVLIVDTTGPEFLVAFFACLYAGLVAVPIAPPRSRHWATFGAIARDARATLAVASTSLVDRLRDDRSGSEAMSALHWVPQIPPVPFDAADRWQPDAAAPDALAYLQYTSGSTGTPKGVMVTHANLASNLRMIEAASGRADDQVFVSWLPLFHDLGLVAAALEAFYVGARCVLLPPLHVLQRPLRWLQAISRYRGTTSGAPNFAYELCLRRIKAEERLTLDLRSWDAAFNGAEPVHARTLEQFAAAFEPAGFRAAAFYPCYGLAEATVFVAGGDRTGPAIRRFSTASLERGVVAPLSPAVAGALRCVDRQDGSVRTLVGCGRAWLGLEMVIVDPASSRRCPADRVGEIWVRGDSVAQGYWGRPRETLETFAAQLADTGDGPFLRTGDLGFVYEGELFVVGRLKEIIIIRGSNYDPHDIEMTAQASHDGLQPHGGAAFSVDGDGEEWLVIVHEVQPRRLAGCDAGQVIADVRGAIAAEHGLRAHAVILVKAGSVPRTTSGKIRRRACREQVLTHTLDVWGADYGDPDCRGRA